MIVFLALCFVLDNVHSCQKFHERPVTRKGQFITELKNMMFITELKNMIVWKLLYPLIEFNRRNCKKSIRYQAF